MATAGRTGYQQSVGTGAYETIFDAGLADGSHGGPLKGIDLLAEGADILVKIWGLNDVRPSGCAVERLRVNQGVSRFATQPSPLGGGLIYKIEAMAVAAGTLSWNPAAK